MPLIQSPNPKPRRVKITLRLDEPLARMVHRYAEFIRASNEYVIAHALTYFFERDLEFKQWIAANPNDHSRTRSRTTKKLQTAASESQTADSATDSERGRK